MAKQPKKQTKQKEEPTVSKEELLSDIKRVRDLIIKKYPGVELVRDHYRKLGKYKDKDFTLYFHNFTEFKKCLFEQEGIGLEDSKKIFTLAEENKALKQQQKAFMQTSISEDIVLDLYKEKELKLKLPEIKFNFKKIDKKLNDHTEAILMLSDFHCGEVIDSKQLNGINQYNVEIMKQRLDRIINYTIYYCTKYEISDINVLFLGDLMSGSIHPELLRTNENNDVETLFILHEYISEKLLEIEPHFNSVKCEFLVGNHSRISDGNSGTKPQWKGAPILNWEYVLAKQLQMQFDLIQKSYKVKKISININDCLFKVIEVAKRKFLITHGHMMSSGSNSFAGIGYYGLAMSSAKMLGAMISTKDDDLLFEDILMGHLHTSGRVKTTNGSLYINGSVIGSGEFGLYKMRSISKPEQTLLFVSNGEIMTEMILRGNE